MALTTLARRTLIDGATRSANRIGALAFIAAGLIAIGSTVIASSEASASRYSRQPVARPPLPGVPKLPPKRICPVAGSVVGHRNTCNH